MACTIQVNGKDHLLLSEIASYVDNSNPGSRSAAKVAEILKETESVYPIQGTPGLFATEMQLRDLRMLNNPKVVPGLIVPVYFKSIPRGPQSNYPTNLYKIEINEDALQAKEKVEATNSDFNYKNQYELDRHNRLNSKNKTETKEEVEKEDSTVVKTYTTTEESKTELHNLALDAKIIVEAELKEVEKLPEEERKRKEKRLKRLQIALKQIKKVDDFFVFVAANKDNIDNAVAEFNDIMSLPIEERATPPVMNRMFEVQQTLASLDTIEKLEDLILDQQALGEKGRLGEMLETLAETISKAKQLNNQFERQAIPVMAEYLVGFHNEAIDPEIQKIIDNVEKHGYWRRFRSEVKTDPDFVELERRLSKGLISEEAFNTQAKNMVLESLKNRKILGRKQLIRDLTNAHRDKSAYSYHLDPLIYSSEPAIQLFAKSVKSATFRKNEMNIDFKYRIKQEYDIYTEGMSETDIASLNDPFIEEIKINTVDVDGRPEETNVLAYVNKVDVNKFKAEKNKIKKELASKYNMPMFDDYKSYDEYKEAKNAWDKTRDARNYNTALSKWDQENQEPIDGYKKEIQRVDDEIKEAAKLYRQAKEKGNTNVMSSANIQLDSLRKYKNKIVNKTTGKPKGALLKPKASKYTNPKWTAIQNDPKKKRYYDFLIGVFKEKQALIGKKQMPGRNSFDEFSYVLPSIRKADFDRVMEQGGLSSAKDILEDSITVQETENNVFGNYNEQTGELQKTVPIFYNNAIDAKDVSKDLASSMYQFADMAHNYKTKSELVGSVMMFKNILGNRETLELNAGGVEYLSKIANDLGVKLPAKKSGEDSYTYKHVDAFIDTIMFGQRELKQNFRVFGKEVSANKIANSINAFTAMNTLGFNFLQGANQSIIDNMALLQEGVAGQFFTTEELAWAKAEYWSNSAALSDVGKFVPETKLGKALEFFDALTEFTDQDGNRLVGSKLRKALQSGNLLVVQQAAEHEVGSTRMLALMKNLEGKLKDKDGNVINKEDGSPANLYDLLTVDKKTGKLSVDSRVANFKKDDFINLLQGLSRRTNQTKGTFDRPTLQRQWYGKLGMLFRSWLNPGIRRFYGHGGFSGPTLHVDEELGTVTQGAYISFWNMMRQSLEQKAWPGSVFDQLTEMEQENIRRVATQMGGLSAAFVLIAALSNLDEEDETWVTNFLLYQALRYQAEVQQWIPIYGYKEAFRIAKSPTATARQVEQTIKLFDQIKTDGLYYLGLPVPEKDVFYQRSTGRYQKGDRKIKKSIEDLLPVLRGLNKSKSPEDAAQYFLGGTYK